MTDGIANPASLIEVFWIEKYLTFAQTADDRLLGTDCMFVGEYALRGEPSDSARFEAALYRNGQTAPVATYDGTDPMWCNKLWVNRKVQSFDSLADLEAAYPPTDRFHWKVSGSEIGGTTLPIGIGGPGGRTDIPQPHPMRLYQEGRRISDYRSVDADKPLTVEWNPFPGGKTGPVVDDLIFLFVDDCHGRVIYFGGLPVDPDYITFRSTSATIPAGTLRRGEDFTVFFSQCRMIDQMDSAGVMNVAVNSFGVELDIRTIGTAAAPCPEPRLKAPFMWLRKTTPGGGLMTWPTIVDGRHCAPEATYNTPR